jgi:hypothetical protein
MLLAGVGPRPIDATDYTGRREVGRAYSSR